MAMGVTRKTGAWILILFFLIELVAFPAGVVWANPAEGHHGESMGPEPISPGQFVAPDVLSESDTAEKLTTPEEINALQRKILDPRGPRHPLDLWRIYDQALKQAERPNEIQFSRLRVEVISRRSQVMASNDFSEPHFELQNLQDGDSIAIVYRGRKIHEFFPQSLRSIVWNGAELFFVEQGAAGSQISFLDLNYFYTAIGQTKIPVFELPVVSSENPHFSVSTDAFSNLYVGNTLVPQALISSYAQLQQTAFNLQVSILDPKTVERALPMVEELTQYFYRAVELAGAGAQRVNENILGGEDMALSRLQAALKVVPEDRGAWNNVLSEISKNHEVQQKFLARVNRLFGFISMPRPQGSRLLEASYNVIAFGTVGAVGIGSVAVTSGLILDPELTQNYLISGVHLVRDIVLGVGGGLRNIGQVTADAAVATFKTFYQPQTLHEAYIADGRWKKLTVGMTAAASTLFLAIGVPHLIVNSIKLVKDMRQLRKAAHESGEGFSLIRNFVQRQQSEEKKFLEALSSSSIHSLDENGNKIEFTPEQTEELKKIVGQLEASRKTWIGSVVEPVRNAVFRKKVERDGPQNFASALSHLLFSCASLTNSGHVYVATWNVWFALRSFVLSPRYFYAFVMHPRYLNTVVSGDKEARLPTRWNGGRAPLHQVMLDRLSRLYDADSVKEMQRWEAAILPFESKIKKAALEAAYQAVSKKITDPDELQKVFETFGIDSLGDGTIEKLSHDNKNYFRFYFYLAFEGAMEKLLRDHLAVDGLERTLRDSKKTDADLLATLDLSEESAKDIVRSVINETLDFEAQVSERVSGFSMERIIELYHLKNTYLMDPSRHRQVNRLQSVNRQKDNPQAMARAVRATRASILVDKPLELMMMFICLAGVTTGINKPLYEEFISDNSLFYLGRYPFFTGYIAGVIMGVFADIWFKLQQDEKNEGKFEDAPQGADSKRGFLSWYMKQTMTKDNSLASNWKFYNKLIWANMKAAFVLYVVLNMVTLGRFELDTYITGYLLAFLTPLGAFAMKVEQGFEKAAHYYAKDIPPHLRAHPDAQKYLNKRIASARIKFNLTYKFYENVMGFFTGTLQTIASTGIGPRALARSLFMGYTPTEIVVNSLEKVNDAVGQVPGVRSITGFCRKMIANRYTDGLRMRP
jgi:hypothetical protein